MHADMNPNSQAEALIAKVRCPCLAAVLSPVAMPFHSKLGSGDPDHRYMALNDLVDMLKGADARDLSQPMEALLVDKVPPLLEDVNSEVQTMCIVWYNV